MRCQNCVPKKIFLNKNKFDSSVHHLFSSFPVTLSPFFLFFDLSSFDSYLTKEPLKDGADSKVAFWESERFSERERLRGEYEWSPWIVVFRHIMLAGLNDVLLVADSFKQEGWESAAMVDWAVNDGARNVQRLSMKYRDCPT